MKFSACIEWLFADEAEDFPNRIRKADAAGLDAIEFWRWSNKDLDGIESALKQTGLILSSFLAEPMIALTDPANKAAFLTGLEESVETARRLGAGILIAQAGNERPGNSRQEQRDSIVDCLRAASDVMAGTDVRLGLEPLNTLIDHKGYFLFSTREALDIVDEIDRPEIGIVYDLYHSYVMGEAIEEVLTDRVGRVFHAHVADHPGRNDPGTGEIDLSKRLAWLFSNGYSGHVGLEYRPANRTSGSIAHAIANLHDMQPR